jgi:hypothetical protein
MMEKFNQVLGNWQGKLFENGTILREKKIPVDMRLRMGNQFSVFRLWNGEFI